MAFKRDIHNCRVCGKYHKDPPWGEYGDAPSFSICSCCGAEFGYEDFTEEGIRAHLERWKRGEAKGAKVSYEDYLAQKRRDAGES